MIAGVRARWAIGAAALWCVGLAALTLVQADGLVLAVAAISLFMVAAVALLLPRHRRLAWAVTVFAYLMVPLGAFTVGPLFIPVALLLLVACALEYGYS